MPPRAELPCRLSFGHQKGRGPPWTWSRSLSAMVPVRWQWGMREPEPQGRTGWALLHSTFSAPDPGQSGDHYTAVHVSRGPLRPGAQDTHTHRKSCLLLAHHTGLAGVHCTPAVAGRARLRVNIGLGLVCRTVGPSCPRSPITGWTWGQQVMGEHRVIPRRAGARSVLATW